MLKEAVEHPSLWLRTGVGHIQKVIRVKNPNLTEDDKIRLSEIVQELTAMAERVAGWGGEKNI